MHLIFPNRSDSFTLKETITLEAYSGDNYTSSITKCFDMKNYNRGQVEMTLPAGTTCTFLEYNSYRQPVHGNVCFTFSVIDEVNVKRQIHAWISTEDLYKMDLEFDYKNTLPF